MNKEWINHNQAGALFFVFMTGSSIINIPGPLIAMAGNGAWISLLLSGLCGFGVLAMLLYLSGRYPGLTYVDYSRKLIGNMLTVIFGLLSLTFLFQMLTAMVMDVGLFMVSSMLRETPIYTFTSLILLISALTARAGIEVMARMFMFIILLTALFVFSTLVFAIPDYMPEQLLPILPKGIRPVLHGAYFSFGFPYAEVFVFGMLLHHVAKEYRKKVPAAMLLSLGVNVLTLCVTTISSIMVFGPFGGDLPYILFSMARLVEFQEIIQRIESIIGMSLILGSYMKSTITLYAASLFAARLFKIEERSALVMPIALFCFLSGLVSFDGPANWGFMVSTVHPLWAGSVFVVPLLLLTVVAAFRKKAA
ncbi:endospore germination permease [Paenibacillus sp. LHD-117]|uniref:GerAB/ArcD/ProY family transporter n=1 Tax=Paenibacillus sp. LHD-117 TaxID=3071412 RepID=UPI0027E0B43C|nr:endospore germination permease [Paenibacillus sp. LHD-117]MDQ6419659.1 endospore germination permease [Paenibacillus sp. LHD-117]